jgi:hypothetical protein
MRGRFHQSEPWGFVELHVCYQFIPSHLAPCTVRTRALLSPLLPIGRTAACLARHISHVRVELWHRFRIHRSPFAPPHSTHPNDPSWPPMHSCTPITCTRAFTFQLAVVIHCGSASGRATFNVGVGSVRVDRRDVLDHSSTGTAANAGTTAWYDSDAVYVDPQRGASVHWSLKCQCLDSPPVAHVRTFGCRSSASS